MNCCECMQECKCLTFQIGECDYCEERKCEYCKENKNLEEDMKGKEEKKKPKSMAKENMYEDKKGKPLESIKPSKSIKR